VLITALLYSVGAHGIMTLNDFKSVEGALATGVRSLPVQLGPANAARLACLVMALPQVGVIALLAAWGRPWHAGLVGALLIGQAVLMVRFLDDPRERPSMSSGCSCPPSPSGRWWGARDGRLDRISFTCRDRCHVAQQSGWNFVLACHLPARPRADGARRRRRADDLDPQPGDGGGTRPAGPGAGAVGGHPLRGAGAEAPLGLRLRPDGPAHLAAGLALAALSFLLVGLGVGAAGTSLLVLLAGGVAPARRGAAATVVWVMMIVGFALTAPLAGHFLEPFSVTRLMAVSGAVSLIAFCLAALAVGGVEARLPAPRPEAAEAKAPFGAVLKKVLADPVARRFTVFVFVSMLAYSAQELILEPYAGLVFGLGPGATTKLAGLQHGGVLAGMLLVAGVTLMAKGTALASLRLWTAVGCAASALALFAIAAGGPSGLDFPLRGAVFALGLANGIYAVAAIGSMMALAGRGGERERGTRMGVWGAAQGVAFGGGGVLGAFAVDAMRLVVGDPVQAYATVFVAEGVLFLVAVAFALRTESAPASYPLDPALEAR